MNKQKIIDKVMDYMNFDKIHKAMEALNWIWYPDNEVPEIPRIRQFVRRLLNQLIDENLKGIQSGGLYISKTDDKIRISFEVTHLDVEI